MPVDFDGFGRGVAPPAMPWGGLVVSGLLHAAAILLIGVLAGAASQDSEPRVRYRVSSFRSLQIRVPEQLLLPASETKRTPAPAPSGGSQGSPGPKGRPGPLVAEGSAARPRPRFELPPLPKSAGKQTLIQLSAAPELKLSGSLRLPSLALWSQLPKAPRPEPKKFVMPGRQAPVKQAPELNLPPQIAAGGVPALELIPDQPPASADPKLAAPPAAGLPVRVFTPPSPKATAEVMIDLPPGEAVNVIALNQNPASIRGTLNIPAGNQIAADLAMPAAGPAGLGAGGNPNSTGQTSQARQGAGLGNRGAGAGAGGGTASGATGTGGQPGDGRGQPGAGVGTGSGTGGTGSGTGGTGVGSGAGTGPGTGAGPATGTGSGAGGVPGGAGAGGSQGTLAADPTPIRILHPENGVFDVVVEQASRGGAADTSVLTGRPLYSVYLKVGTAKEWVLHYCIPKSTDSFRQSGPVISLGSPAKVIAPYPILTLVPSSAVLAKLPRVLVHGFMTPHGQFRDLSAMEEDQQSAAKDIWRYLKQWEFRPATRAGTAVEIEILLVIPAHGSE